MKILHIGKQGNMERFTQMPERVRAMEQADIPMNLEASVYLEQAGDADVIVADAMARIPAELIDGMPNLKLICSEGVAYNSIDCEAASRRGIYVTNNQGMNADAVAEQTLLLMVGMLRQVTEGDRAVREGRQITMKEGFMATGDLRELSDLKLGLIGMGDIARSVVRLLRAYRVETIYYYKRHRLAPNEEQELGITYLPQEELLAHSDMVSLHLPVTPETREMADDAFFARMKQGAYFVNTSRGELVDSAALVRAIESGRVAMAGLDTLDHEPVQADHFLVTRSAEIEKHLLFSPHIGGITASSFRRGYEMVWENVLLVADGQQPKRVVNRV